MIIFDESTGKFRDAETGRLRSDVSGLLSSNARRQFKNFAGNVNVAEYRRKLGQKFYKAGAKTLTATIDDWLEYFDGEYTEDEIVEASLEEPEKKRGIFEETSITDYSKYINDWLQYFNFVLDEEDTDMETP